MALPDLTAALSLEEGINALTVRQRQVLLEIGRGLSEKEIASELKMSPSRVTQHVRALKDRLGTEKRSGLVNAAALLRTYEEIPEAKIRVPDAFAFGEAGVGDRPDRATLSDAGMAVSLPQWDFDAYDRVGPGALDGKGAALKRAALILLIGLGAPVLILLVQAAMVALGGMRI